MSKFNDITVEKTILVYLLKNSDYVEEAVTKITASTFFDENNRKLFDLINRYFKKYHKALSRDILEKFLKKREKEFSAELQLALLMLYDEILKIHIDDSGFRFYLNELKELEIKRELYATVSTIIEDLSNDRSIPESLADLTEKILDIKTLDSFEEVIRKPIYGSDTEERWEEYVDKKTYPEKYKGIPYGIEELDQVTGGQFPSKLGMVFGRMKKGKSRLLFNVGCNVSDLSYKVMYVTIEMELKMLQTMWESRYTGITFNDILNAKLTEEEECIYKSTLEQLKNKECPFYVVDISRGVTPATIDYEIILHQKVFGVKPSVVLIDYANLMTPNSRFKDRSEKYDNIFRELKEVARTHKVSILTAAQQNRKSLDVRQDEVDTEHIALSDMAGAHADIIFNIWHGSNPTEEVATQLAKRVYLKIVASRYSESKTIELFADFSVNFIGDLERLQKIWKKVKRNDKEF
jgi:replicative DNA helicase